MALKEAKKKEDKERERAQERRELEQQQSYNPYGRGGSGAPNNQV